MDQQLFQSPSFQKAQPRILLPEPTSLTNL
jgi:hypothetical protein